MFRDIPIRRKLMFIILLTSVMVMLMMRLSFFIYEYVSFRQSTARQLSTLGEIIAANSTAALAFDNPDDANQTLAALQAENHIEAACLYDRAGNLFAQYPGAITFPLPEAPGREGYRFEGAHLSGFQPVVQGGRRLGTLYLKLDTGSIMHDWLWVSGSIGVALMTLVLFLAYLVSRALQQQISQPIISLAGTARAVAERRDYSVRAAKQGRDELGSLTDAFNGMLTQIERQNRELAGSERRFRALIEHSSDSISVIDDKNNILYLSPSVEAVEGFTPEQLIGRNGLENTHPDDLPVVQETVQKALENPGAPIPVQWRRKHKNGEWLWLEGVATNLLDDPAVRGLVTNYRDVTRRKQVEEQLSLQATALETAANAIVITDRSGTILWINPAFTALTGYPPEEVVGRTPRILKSGQHDQAFYKALWGTILGGKIWRGEFVNRRKDGSLYHDEHTIAPVRGRDGGITHFIAIMQDITARKKAEEEIRNLNATLEQRIKERTAQLEAVNKELEAFSYSVSHDLRAPLRHISGFADMFQSEASASLDDTGRRYLGIISEAAQRMGALIDDLLVFSRMGRAEIRRTRVNMDELVAEVLSEMATDLAGRNIKWDIGSLPGVKADRSMLKQVWVNLISNAVKYTRQHDQAEIEIKCRENNPSEWEFSVRDNGAGFDMKYAGKLFGVFQRLHHAEEFEGTGIGLANVRRIVARHGGRTWAEGKVDAGATFYFTLPNIQKKQT